MCIGDAQSLSKTLYRQNAQEGFDVVTSVFTMMHLADPLAALKGVYGVLNDGGIGLVHSLDLSLIVDDPGKLQRYLRKEYGFRIGYEDNMSFKKSTQRLFLPLSYGKQGYEAERVGYVVNL